jgi:hypothetical protein
VTWTLPLSVTVNLGGEIGPAVSTSAETLLPPPITPRSDDTELQEALAELAEARTRVYYDADADQTAAEEYYGGIETDVSAEVLFEWSASRISCYRPTRCFFWRSFANRPPTPC